MSATPLSAATKTKAFAVAASLALVFAPVVSAQADDSSDVVDLSAVEVDSSIARANSRSADAAIMVRGIVARNAEPVEGAAIVARIWPATETLIKVADGAPAGVKIVDVGYTDSHGNYTIQLDPRLVPASYYEADGTVSVQLWAVFDGKETPWSLSVVSSSTAKSDSAGWATKALLASGESGAPTVDFELGNRPNVKQHDDSAEAWITPDGDRLGDVLEGDLAKSSDGPALVDGGVVAPMAAEYCWTADPVGGTWYYDNRERFVRVNTWTGAKAKVKVAVGQSSGHTVGVGYKANGGSWGANGTVEQSVSTSASATSAEVMNVYVHNSINYRRWNCALPNVHDTIVGQEMRPAGFYDIVNEPHTIATHPTLTLGCVTKSAGSDINKNSGTNTTYGGGITTPLLNLSAKSGYNQGTSVYFDVKQRSEICGNSSQGWLAASQVEVHSK